MKKILFFAAFAAMAMTTACNKMDNPVRVDGPEQEIMLMSVADVTKGYVEGDTFVDSPYDKLHGQTPDGKTDRTMHLSAYLTPQSGLPSNYFVGEVFSKNANGETDNLWHHNPKVYWPLGGTLNFLAYSSTTPFAGTAVNWDEENAASKLVLNVSEEYLQDDILFGAVNGRTTSNGASVAMTFNHAQAWIQFQIKVGDEDMENIVKVEDIVIKDLYTRGELTLNGGATPSAEWNFRRETAIDKAMDDTYEVLAPNFIPKDYVFMDMLVPEQPQTVFVMHYTLAGQDTVLEYEFPLASANWQMGKKYIYQITINPYEITVTPTVTTFVDTDPGHSTFPQVIE